jgi:hypothetical protein
LLNEFFVLVISCSLIGFCNDYLSSEGEEILGWFLIVWINLIAGFNMLLALYKTAKETYELLREKCCPKKNIDIHPKDDNANSDVKDLKARGANESVDL